MVAISSNGTGGGNWSVGASWNGGISPAEGDRATILNGDTITIDGNITVGDDTATSAITINATGILDWPSTVVGDYTLTCKGDFTNNGTFSLGSVANPIPNTRTAIVKLNYSAALADGKYGLISASGSTLTLQGAADRILTDRCFLDTDEVVNSTALSSDVNTGWKNNDRIAIASTSRTYSECEAGAMNGDAVADALTVDGFGGVGGGLAYAHSGTSPTQAEIINLTRNVVITAYDTSAVSYVYFGLTPTVDVDWIEFSYLGENASNKRGVEIGTTTGSCSLNRCSIHDCEDYGLYIAANNGNNIIIENCVMYNLASLVGHAVNIVLTSGTWTINNCIMILASASSAAGFNINDWGGTFTNNTAVGARGYGISLNEGNLIGGTYNNLIAHSGGTQGIVCQAARGGTISNITVWRNTNSGIVLSAVNAITVDTVVSFGNTGDTLNFWNGLQATIINLISNGDTTFSTTSGVTFSSGYTIITRFKNCDFSTVAGIKTAHTQDISCGVSWPNAVFENCKFGAAVEVATQGSLLLNAFISSQKHDQTVANHKTWKKYGTISYDAVIFDVTPSVRLTPNNASGKLECPVGQVYVNSGETAQVSVKVRESVVGDGTDYNGNRARLICKANVAAGIATDQVLDTATNLSEGGWELLTGTTPAITDDAVLDIVIDCDGTTGWINADTGSVV